jgi:hypothetical protein
VQEGLQRHQRSQKCDLLAQGQDEEQMPRGGQLQGLHCGQASESLSLRRAQLARLPASLVLAACIGQQP